MNNKTASIVAKVIASIIAICFIIAGIMMIKEGIEAQHTMPDFNDLEDFMEESSDAQFFFVFGGFTIFLGTGILMVTLIISLVKKFGKSVKEGKIVLSPVFQSEEEKEHFCEYCGSKIEKGQTKCKNCGAVVTRSSK